MLVREVGGVALVGGGVAMPTGVWLWVTVLVGVVGGVPLVGSGVVVSMGVGLPLGSAVLGALLVAVLSPEERCEMHTYICNYSVYGPAIFQRELYASPTVDFVHYTRFSSLPVVTVLVGIVNGVLLPGVVGGVALVGGGDVILVGIWPCVIVMVGMVGGVPLVGSGVALSVEVGLPVASAVFELLVVLGPVEV